MDLPLAAIFSIFFLLMLAVLAADRRATRKTIEAVGARLEARIDVGAAKTDARFDIVDARFDAVDARFDHVDKKIAELDRDVHAVMDRMMDR